MKKAQNSTEHKVQESKDYTGIAEIVPYMVNPTMEEAKKAGINLKKDPQYVEQKDDGTTRVRIDFYYKSPKDLKDKDGKPVNLKGKITFFIEDDFATNKNNDKVQVSNQYGIAVWADGVDPKQEEVKSKFSWFKTEGFKKALRGEENLLKFIIALGNYNTGENDTQSDECRPDFDAILKGDFSELKEWIQGVVSVSGSVKVLLGMQKRNNNYFSVIYTGYFQRAYLESTKNWVAHIDNSHFRFGSKDNPATFQNSLQLQEFDPELDNKNDTEIFSGDSDEPLF